MEIGSSSQKRLENRPRDPRGPFPNPVGIHRLAGLKGGGECRAVGPDGQTSSSFREGLPAA